MSRSTFSGPISAGTVREGPSSNLGNVVLSQSFDSGDLTGAEVGNLDTAVFAIPAGAQIVDIVVDQVVAATAGTTTVSVGTAAGGAQLMAGIATTAGGRFRGTATAATQLAWLIGTDDQVIHVRAVVGTATLTAGRFILTVNYVQK